MTLRLLILLPATLFTLTALPAQETAERPIRDAIATYLGHCQKQDVPAILDALYPGIYAILPRDQMESYFQRFFLDPEVRFRFESMDIRKVHPAYEDGGRTWARVDYHTVMTMTYQKEEKDAEILDMLKESLVADYGEDKVTTVPGSGIFRIEADKIMLVVRQDGAWKVMDFEPTLLPFLKDMDIPESVVDHFRLKP